MDVLKKWEMFGDNDFQSSLVIVTFMVELICAEIE